MQMRLLRDSRPPRFPDRGRSTGFQARRSGEGVRIPPLVLAGIVRVGTPAGGAPLGRHSRVRVGVRSRRFLRPASGSSPVGSRRAVARPRIV